jgi:hypothetical protein
MTQLRIQSADQTDLRCENPIGKKGLPQKATQKMFLPKSKLSAATRSST